MPVGPAHGGIVAVVCNTVADSPRVPAQNAIVISAADYADFARLAK